MKIVTNLILCFLLIHATAITAQTDMNTAELASYRIRFEQDRPLTAHVMAQIPVYGGELQMSSFGAWTIKDGWGTYIADLHAVDANGQTLPAARVGRNRWRLPETVSDGIVSMSYTVDFSHATLSEWPDGVRTTASYFDGVALYTTARPLLIYGKTDMPVQISFELPAGRRVSAPWEGDGTVASPYRGADLETTANNALVIGRHDEMMFDAGPFVVTAVALDGRKASAELIAPVVKTHLAYYADLFGHTKTEPYLITLFKDKWDSGEAFRNSFTMVGPEAPDAQNKVIWGSRVGHELFHAWNGQRIMPADWSLSQWFQEGFTEYMSNLSSLRNRVITEGQFLTKMQTHISHYLLFRNGAPFEKVSLVEAGRNKSVNNVALYDGGWVIAFCLDTVIRERTDHEKSMADLMRALNDRFGKTGDKYSNEDVVDAVKNIAGQDIGDFFSDYVFGTGQPPLLDYLHRAGFTAVIGGAEVHLSKAPNASEDARKIREALLTVAPR